MSAEIDVKEPFAPPVVDALTVRVVVDSSYERFMPKAEHDAVKVQHLGHLPGRQMSTLAAEWGLSLHLESEMAGAKAQYLLDFGYTPEVINRNFELLDIDPAKIGGLILSHGHRDHYGGLEGFVTQFRAHMPEDVSLFIGGEGIFRERWIKAGAKDYVSWGAPNRTLLTAQEVMPVACEAPHALHGPFTSGYIERDSFEKVTGGSMLEAEAVGEDHFSKAERHGKLVLDEHHEEHATCYIVQGRGLVVISSCGHTGIVNTMRTAMKTANVDKVHAVIGGFHLGAAPQDYIDRTVTEMLEMSPDVVVPMHCSGTPFIETMRRRAPDRLVTSNLGSRFVFGV